MIGSGIPINQSKAPFRKTSQPPICDNDEEKHLPVPLVIEFWSFECDNVTSAA